MEKIVKKYEINCDMGEGFGRWKMVCTYLIIVCMPLLV